MFKVKRKEGLFMEVPHGNNTNKSRQLKQD